MERKEIEKKKEIERKILRKERNLIIQEIKEGDRKGDGKGV